MLCKCKFKISFILNEEYERIDSYMDLRIGAKALEEQKKMILFLLLSIFNPLRIEITRY